MEGESRRSVATSNKKTEEEAQAQVDIWKYVFGFVDMAVVKCAIELGIPDVLEAHGGPMTLSDLSTALRCSPAALHRIMRFLAHKKIFKEDFTKQGGPISYVQTPLSRLLMKNGENSMASLLLIESSPMVLDTWHDLSARVLATFEAAPSADIWKHAAANPDGSKLVDDAMACGARATVPAIIEDCPEVFDGLSSLVDVGGGNGTAIQMIVKACPWIRGINFDLPRVVAVAPDYAGVEHVRGDMFDSIPKADAVFIMWVLHDWADDECIQILKKCREAIPKDKGKVIIVEGVIEEDEGDKLKYVRLMMDMVMMAHTNRGKERTLKELAYVISEAGFSRYTVKRIQAVQSIIEAYP